MTMANRVSQYGVLICIGCHDFRRWDLLLGLGLYFLIPCHLFLAYVIEAVAAKQAIGSKKQSESSEKTRGPSKEQAAKFWWTWVLIAWFHSINVVVALAYMSYVVYYHVNHPLIGTITELHAIIVLLKTYSYAFTNRDLRHAFLHPSDDDLATVPEIYSTCSYPDNITMGNLVYFWWTPTLVYQPVYPRTDKIRWVFVFKRLVEAFCLGVFIWFISAQYAAPLMKNAIEKFETRDYSGILERVLKLSTISLVIWLAGFFAFFQSTLNALAEITRFGDRSFYDDWWNSESLGVYWKTWNKPVYHFFKRHVYMPMVGRGYSSKVAGMTVFFISAVLHELLVGVPTHNIIGEFPCGREGMHVALMLAQRSRIRWHVHPGDTGDCHDTVGEDKDADW
jgi:diacylglycerol O-acyltransferase 1